MSLTREFSHLRHAIIVLSLLTLSSCGIVGNDTAKGPRLLHLACQTVECDCRAGNESMFGDRKTTEIVWRRNGDATCPAGYVLERVEVDFLGRRR